MPVSLFEKLADDMLMFPDTVELLRICGNGEPLMNEGIVQMLRCTKEKKIAKRTELFTNGIMLTADLIKDLPRLLDKIIISVEGLSSEDYQHACGVNINFQNLLNNLDDLYSRKGKCIIHIKIFHEAVLSERRKAEFLGIFGKRCDEIYIEKTVPMWPQLHIACSHDEFRWGGRPVEHRICAQIFKSVQVQADGEVVPCCVDWRRINVLGDINKNTLYEIWNCEKLRRLQIEHLSGNKNGVEPCRDCRMNDYCEIDNIDTHAEECMRRLRKITQG